MNITKTWLKFKRTYLPSKFSSKDLNKLLKINGILIGKGTYFFGPSNTEIDIQRPTLLKIGEYCKITTGVKILTHDYSRSVLRMKYGEIFADARETIIGNNVFIGINSIILPGAHIGNNVIIGAGSVVSGDIPDDTVAAGNPAKVIRTLEEHYNRRKDRYIDEAKKYATSLIENDIEPTINNMGAFFPIYLQRDINELKKYGINTKLSGDNEEDIINKFLDTKPVYNSFDEFMKDVKNIK